MSQKLELTDSPKVKESKLKAPTVSKRFHQQQCFFILIKGNFSVLSLGDGESYLASMPSFCA